MFYRKQCFYCFNNARYRKDNRWVCSFSCAGIDIYQSLREYREKYVKSQSIPKVVKTEPPLEENTMFNESVRLLCSTTREKTLEERLFRKYCKKERKRAKEHEYHVQFEEVWNEVVQPYHVKHENSKSSLFYNTTLCFLSQYGLTTP